MPTTAQPARPSRTQRSRTTSTGLSHPHEALRQDSTQSPRRRLPYGYHAFHSTPQEEPNVATVMGQMLPSATWITPAFREVAGQVARVPPLSPAARGQGVSARVDRKFHHSNGLAVSRFFGQEPSFGWSRGSGPSRSTRAGIWKFTTRRNGSVCMAGVG